MLNIIYYNYLECISLASLCNRYSKNATLHFHFFRHLITFRHCGEKLLFLIVLALGTSEP
jgi:hypothetical protein